MKANPCTDDLVPKQRLVYLWFASSDAQRIVLMLHTDANR